MTPRPRCLAVHGRAHVSLAVAAAGWLAACGPAPAPPTTPDPQGATIAPAEATAALDAGDSDASPNAASSETPFAWFREPAPDRTGLDVVMTSGALRTREILEVNGGGVGLLDFDGDGDLDVFVAVGATLAAPDDGPPSRLFRNDGGLQFVDVTAEAGIDLRGWSTGVAVGDVDGDQRDDLFVGRLRGGRLLLNRTGPDGTATFVDATADATADGAFGGGWITSAAFGDLDGDDDLDLYAVRYLEFDPAAPPARASFKGIEVMGGPHGLPATHDSVFENVGGGRFVDRTDAWTMRPPSPAYGLNVVIVDALPDPDADTETDDPRGWPEIIVGNDSQANFVWQRQPDGRWRDVGFETGLASNGDGAEQATMGMAVADVNDDGWPDFFTTNFSSDTNTLHVSGPSAYFADATRRAGLGIVSRPYLGWSAWFADWDHDGHEDLLMVNGHVYPEATPEVMDSPWEQPPLLFARQANRLRFDRVTGPDWLATPRRDRTAAFGDLDGDGDVDAIVGELNRPVRILESLAADRRPEATADPAPDWLIVALSDERDGAGNHRGLGATVSVTHGDRTWTRWIFGGGGFQSSNAPEAHVVVPGASATRGVRVAVRWPDGHEQILEDVRPGRRVVVRRGSPRP